MEERELNEFASEIQDKGIRKMFVYLTRGFVGVKDELKELKQSVDSLQQITITQENGSRVEHMFHRNQFFQKIYDEIEEIKCRENNRMKMGFTKISDYARLLIPILMIIALILGLLGYSHLAEQIKQIK